MYERLPLRSRNEKSDRKIENTEVKKEVSKKGSAVSQAKQPIWTKSKTYEKNMHGMASTLRGQATPASSQRRLGRVGPQVRRRRGLRHPHVRRISAREPLRHGKSPASLRQDGREVRRGGRLHGAQRRGGDAARRQGERRRPHQRLHARLRVPALLRQKRLGRELGDEGE